MLQKNKNNKKVALSLICSCRSFLLCQMKSITYTGIYPGWVKIRMFYIQSSAPSERDICWLCPPSPVPCPCWRGHWGSTTVMWCVGARPGCSQTSPQIQQNLLSPPVPLPWPFYSHPRGDFAVIEENRSFSCPSHTAAVQAPSEWDIMPWLLFTAIKLCWQLHKFFPWGILHLLASNRQNLVCFQSILEGFIRHHKHAPKSDTMVSSGKVSNLMET